MRGPTSDLRTQLCQVSSLTIKILVNWLLTRDPDIKDAHFVGMLHVRNNPHFHSNGNSDTNAFPSYNAITQTSLSSPLGQDTGHIMPKLISHSNFYLPSDVNTPAPSNITFTPPTTWSSFPAQDQGAPMRRLSGTSPYLASSSSVPPPIEEMSHFMPTITSPSATTSYPSPPISYISEMSPRGYYHSGAPNAPPSEDFIVRTQNRIESTFDPLQSFSDYTEVQPQQSLSWTMPAKTFRKNYWSPPSSS